MKRFLYVTHLSGRRISRIWLSAFRAAQQEGYEVHLACNAKEADARLWAEDCAGLRIIFHQIDFGRNPFDINNIRAGQQLYALMKDVRFDAVHCNTPVGGVIGRICARLTGTPLVIYQAHGFHFYKGAPLISWLLFYPIERMMAGLTDILITINREDHHRALGFAGKKVQYVPGVGVDRQVFYPDDADGKRLRRELGISPDEYVLLSVGEMNANKNHQAVIRALAMLRNCRYVICGDGPDREKLTSLAEHMGVSDKVIMTGYREDIVRFCRMADVFVFPSFREGLPLSLMEAMSCGLPSVCSAIRGNTDLVEDGVSGILSDNSPEAIGAAIGRLMDNPQMMKRYGEKAIEKSADFDMEAIIGRMRSIYSPGRN